MKNIKTILTTILFTGITIVSTAQPLPPEPGGDPVPVEGFLAALLVAMAGIGIKKLWQEKKK